MSCPDRVEGGKSSLKRRSTGGGQDKQVTQEQTKMFEAVEELNAATYSSADCTVIVMVVSVFCRMLLFSTSVLLSIMMICKSSAYLITKCGSSTL
jgi:hypothetical protein